MQPTSPLRTYDDIDNGYKLLIEKKADSIIAVCEMEHSPLWSNTLPGDLSMKEFLNKKIADKPRQLLPTFYRINGALYIKKINYKNDDVYLLDENSFALIMQRRHSIDIDTEFDFKMAEILLSCE